MSVGTVFGIALITVVVGGVLRQYHPTLAIWVSLVGGSIVLLGCIGQIQSIIQTMEQLLAKTQMEYTFLWLLLKAVGICYVCQFAGDLCKDGGETALAGYVELAGKIMVVGLSLPMIQQVVEIVVKLIAL